MDQEIRKMAICCLLYSNEVLFAIIVSHCMVCMFES